MIDNNERIKKLEEALQELTAGLFVWERAEEKPDRRKVRCRVRNVRTLRHEEHQIAERYAS